MPRNSLETDTEPSRTATEHSILVNPPGLGGQPFYVNLPAEAISASPAIAISARRTLQISPSASGRSERVVIGRLKSHSDPFYPVEARKQRIEGSVELQARVGRTGQIIGVAPVSGPGLLASAAASAVREWRYEPTFIDGDPVETQANITIVFRLQ
jgi:TonB family protein